jgi:hypothetical protein
VSAAGGHWTDQQRSVMACRGSIHGQRYLRRREDGGSKAELVGLPMSALPPIADVSQRSDLMIFQSAIVSFERAPCL